MGEVSTRRDTSAMRACCVSNSPKIAAARPSYRRASTSGPAQRERQQWGREEHAHSRTKNPPRDQNVYQTAVCSATQNDLGDAGNFWQRIVFFIFFIFVLGRTAWIDLKCMHA